MEKTATYWIDKYNLIKHPEGGYYRRVYESNIKITDDNLPLSFLGQRHLVTSIYYLLESHEVSVFHRLKSDEIWYYHFGSSAIIHIFHENDEYEQRIIGPTKDAANDLQVVIPAGSIFGAEINDAESYGLFGCMVSPGFDFADFEIIEKDYLLKINPAQKDIILKLT